jgi:predicted anti-sigma-YlaC factor YlaD
LALLAGCSLRQLAVDAVGDALAAGGSVYETDADAALVGDALPFSVKLMDSLVAESPRHRGLLLAASRAYLLYAWGYVGFRAEQLTRDDVEAANAVRERAHRLALRAFDYAMRGIEIRHPGLRIELARDPTRAIRAMDNVQDVDLLHAAMAALGVAIGNAKQDAAMLARLPEVEAMLGQALALDEAWNAGALHEFGVSWYAARPGLFDRAALERHYARALMLSQGTRAGLFVAYAEGVSIREQDRRQFDALLDRALAVDPEARPEERLQNSLARQRALWLRTQTDQLFVD